MRNEMKQLNDESFWGCVNENRGLLLVTFSADWCSACQVFKGNLEGFLNGQPAINGFVVDVESSPKISDHFAIRSLPTTLVFWNEVLIEKMIGVQTLATLNHAVNRYLVPA